MIMLLTHRADLREQIAKLLEAKGHPVCVPPHRTEVTTEMKESQPKLVVLDMYLDNPAGRLVLQHLRQDGFGGAVIALSGPSQAATIRDSHSLGLHRVLQHPVQIAGSYDLRELETAIDAALHPD
ncbi:MAG: response regulator [Nitrospiraceae bacterium]